MEIKGKIVQILPEVTGTGKKGNWTKQEFILETPSQYAKKVCFSMWNKAIFEAGISEGETVTAHIDIESREYNGRWYTEVKAWKIDHAEDFDPTDTRRDNDAITRNDDLGPSSSTDDLPF